jgi:hypothetical protein
MRSASVGLLICLVLSAGCSGKKQLPPLPDPVEFEGKLTGAEGKQLVLNFKALDEDVAKRAKDIPSAVVDPKTGVFKGKAVPGSYEVTAQPIPQGGHGGTEGPGPHSIGAILKPTPLGKLEIPTEGKKDIVLKFPR